MGLMSGLFSRRVPGTEIGYITPGIIQNNNWTNFLPPTNFDDLIYVANVPLLKEQIAGAFLVPWMHNINDYDFLRHFEQLGTHFRITSTVYNFLGAHSQLSKDFQLCVLDFPGQRIDFQIIDSFTKEFMVSTAAFREMPSRGLRSIIGPKTLKIFEKLGYNTTKTQNTARYQILSPYDPVLNPIILNNGPAIEVPEVTEMMEIYNSFRNEVDPILRFSDTATLNNEDGNSLASQNNEPESLEHEVPNSDKSVKTDESSPDGNKQTAESKNTDFNKEQTTTHQHEGDEPDGNKSSKTAQQYSDSIRQISESDDPDYIDQQITNFELEDIDLDGLLDFDENEILHL